MRRPAAGAFSVLRVLRDTAVSAVAVSPAALLLLIPAALCWVGGALPTTLGLPVLIVALFASLHVDAAIVRLVHARRTGAPSPGVLGAFFDAPETAWDLVRTLVPLWLVAVAVDVLGAIAPWVSLGLLIALAVTALTIVPVIVIERTTGRDAVGRALGLLAARPFAVLSAFALSLVTLGAVRVASGDGAVGVIAGQLTSVAITVFQAEMYLALVADERA